MTKHENDYIGDILSHAHETFDKNVCEQTSREFTIIFEKNASPHIAFVDDNINIVNALRAHTFKIDDDNVHVSNYINTLHRLNNAIKRDEQKFDDVTKRTINGVEYSTRKIDDTIMCDENVILMHVLNGSIVHVVSRAFDYDAHDDNDENDFYRFSYAFGTIDIDVHDVERDYVRVVAINNIGYVASLRNTLITT